MESQGATSLEVEVPCEPFEASSQISPHIETYVLLANFEYQELLEGHVETNKKDLE